MDESAAGHFWIEGGTQVPGRLVLGDRDVRVVTEAPIRASQSIRTEHGETTRSIELSLDPQEVVADSVPVNVLGTLVDGRSITLLSAAIDTGQVGFHQVHSGIRLVVGALISAPDALLPAARLAIPSPSSWHALHEGSAPLNVDFGDVRGGLRSYVESEELWVELSLTSGLAEREWERRFWWRCMTLLNMWTEQKLQPARVQLRTAEAEAWVEVILRRAPVGEHMSVSKSLLDPQRLTAQDVAHALACFDEWAPIQDVASRHLQYEVTLELAVLSYASALEGIHRRCHDKSKVFPELSNAVARKVAKEAAAAAVAAAAAAGAVLEDQEDAHERFLQRFQNFNEPTYADRLRELIAPICAVAPGLLGNDPEEWIKAIRRARNAEAHRLLPTGQATHEEHIDEYYQLATSADWALRLTVLLQLGVRQDELHRRLRSHAKFLYALANMDRCDYAWPGSRIETFRASTFTEAPQGSGL